VEARNNTKEAKKYIEICVSARALILLGQAEHLESLAAQGRLCDIASCFARAALFSFLMTGMTG
jgi:hypothetical protein